jgi:iron(III) transport system permease protein
VIVLAGLFAAEKALYGRHYAFRWGSKEAIRIPLGRNRYLALALTVALAALFVLTPLLGLVLRGFRASVLSDAIERAGSSTIRSVVYAAISATVLSVLGFFLGYLIDRRSLATWRLLEASALFLFILPGSIVGIGMIALWNRQSTNWIYATPVILVLGFIAQYAALNARIIGAGFSQVPSSLEEAAEVAGAGWFRRLWAILAPVNRRALLVAWIITFLFCVRDVPLPLLLAPPGGDTLTARTMTLMANGSAELIAGLCILSVLVALLPLGAAGAAWRMWRRVA